MSTQKPANLRKAASVMGKTLNFRNVQIHDAGFILSLRIDTEKSKYLSSVSGDLDEQRAWLERYSKDDSQAYFIIEYQGEAIGTIRLYDPQGSSFCWVSWILINSRPNHAAMESALMVYASALDHLGFTSAHFDVRKGNERIWQFHERFGAVRVGESEEDYFYRLDHTAIDKSRQRYRRFLEDSVKVELQ